MNHLSRQVASTRRVVLSARSVTGVQASSLYGARTSTNVLYKRSLFQMRRASLPAEMGEKAAVPLPIISRAILWMEKKIPNGFGRFYRPKKDSKAPEAKGAPAENGKGGEKPSEAPKPKDSKKATDETKASSSGDGGIGGSSRQKEPEPPEADKLALLMATAGALFGVIFVADALVPDTMKGSKEISWQEFKTRLLATGEVERIKVVNNARAEIVLRPSDDSKKGERATESWDTDQGSKEMNADKANWSSSKGGSQADKKPLGGAGKNRTNYYFTIGSVEGLERKLEDTQREMGINTHDFIPVQYVTEPNYVGAVLSQVPSLLMMGALFWIISKGISGAAGGGGGGSGGIRNMFNIGKVNPATNKGQKVKVTFKDVAGCDEAKLEIQEFVQFLKNPERFTKLGAKIPKGALLVGPPGTGKTLLAKATAGESNVPFFSMSGSDFIEMFVGVGPSRVRDLFKKARESAPCIVFIDEIDAVARARSKGGFSGGNDERENTLNQLLVEMDGFATSEGVVVLGGTNRADILDKAILRPGRFDRQIMVDRPDIKGRMQIFQVHLQGKTLADPVDDIARRMSALTPGFVGADIANICNEAAIQGARNNRDAIIMADFEKAVDRVIGGLEKRNSVMTPDEKKTVAYHEAGHAIAGWFLEHADPLLKVTIIPRSNGALGFAQYLPREMSLQTTEQFIDMICMALGGRAAEEICFGKVTNGASNDLQKVTKIAHTMVTQWGMNSKLGQLSYAPEQETQFVKAYSESTALLIDSEVKAIVDKAYERTLVLLREKEHLVRAVGDLLLEKETISQHDVEAIAGERQWKHPKSYAEFLEQAGQKEKVEEVKEAVEDKEAEKGTDGPTLSPAI